MTQSSLVWGVKRSFLRYLSNLPGTQASIADGAASTRDHRFVFPAADPIQSVRTMMGTVKFEGEVRFTSHGGMLDVMLADPWLEIDGSTARLSFMTNREAGRRERIVIADLLEQQATSGDSTRLWETTLAQPGVRVFGDTYLVGELMDPVWVVPSLQHG